MLCYMYLQDEDLFHLVDLREDASVQHGHTAVQGVPAVNSTGNTLLAVARYVPILIRC